VNGFFGENLDGPSRRMFDEAALAPVRQLNAHALDLLSECSRHPAWSGSDWESALGAGFLRLPAELRDVLAKSPVSLLEFCSAEKAEAHPAFLPLNKALELSHSMLTLAWTLSRQDAAAAAIVFGLGGADAQRIHGIAAIDLPRVSERFSGRLRPRWLDRPRIWQELLRYPPGARSSHLAPPFLRIVQRQLVEVRPATGVSRSTRPIWR
jgi:hypothetical protein